MQYKYIAVFLLCILLILLSMNINSEGFQDKKGVKFVFVCHSQETVDKILTEQPDYTDILFVGSNNVDPNPRVVICRNLDNNIESEKKLLTFTAWYAIVNNNLYSEYDYICILEYDVIIEPGALESIQHMPKDNIDIISFSMVNTNFLADITIDLLNSILNTNYGAEQPWYPSTNQCVRRDILVDFVRLYSDKYKYIKENDPDKISWYHERLFSIYMFISNRHVIIMPGISHVGARSHMNSNLNTYRYKSPA